MGDSTAETLRHNRAVRRRMEKAAFRMFVRGWRHDMDKAMEPIKKMLDRLTPRPPIVFGTPEYEQHKRDNLQPALDAHYAISPHHPEYHARGVYGMSLFDVFEMLFDWQDTCEVHGNQNIYKTIEIGSKVYLIDGLGQAWLKNTVKEMDEG